MGDALERWAKQDAEWHSIAEELMVSRSGPVTAYQVSLEQQKRMLSRGERPVTLAEIEAAATETGSADK